MNLLATFKKVPSSKELSEGARADGSNLGGVSPGPASHAFVSTLAESLLALRLDTSLGDS